MLFLVERESIGVRQMSFIKFGDLEDGDQFIALRGGVYVKKTPNSPETFNAHKVGVDVPARFNEATLVRRYDSTVHNQTAAIVSLNERRRT